MQNPFCERKSVAVWTVVTIDVLEGLIFLGLGYLGLGLAQNMSKLAALAHSVYIPRKISPIINNA
jgi:hypothetical protein